MFPQPIGNRWNAVIQAAIIALMAFLEIRITLNIVAGQRYLGIARLPALWAFMLAVGIAMFIYVEVQILQTERHLRAAIAGDEHIAPRATKQPNPSQALQPGETLRLSRLTRSGVFWRNVLLVLCLGPLCFVTLAGIGELYIYLAFPHAVGWLAAFLEGPRAPPFPTLPSDLSLFEWGSFLAPLALAALAAGMMLWGPFIGRREDIIVTDAGITVRHPFSRPRFIPWDDIHLILRYGADEVRGTIYWLRGHQHGLILDPGVIAARPTAKGKPQRPLFAFEGGPDAYLAGIRRLLATLTARAHLPIRVWATGYYASGALRRPVSASGLTLDEALAMPLADSRFQSTPAEVEEARSSSDQTITLRDRIPFRELAPQLRKSAASNAGGFAILMLVEAGIIVTSSGWGHLLSLSGALTLLAGVALGGALGIYLRVISYRDDTSPSVVAGPDGFKLKKFNDRPLATMAWGDIRAWAVLPPEPGELAPVVYAVWSENQTLQWTEPPGARLAGSGVRGDRREAYRATARQLHALIAVRTGLPLRMIQPRSSAWSV